MACEECSVAKSEMAEVLYERQLRDQLAMHCPITMSEYIEAHYDELKTKSSDKVLPSYCAMRYAYADAMLAARTTTPE